MSSARHRAICRLLAEETVSTQADLVGLLADQQMPVTQATVSRDLHELGAFKERGTDGSVRYRIGTASSSSGADTGLARAFEEHVVRITPTNGLVVVTTLPGAAQVVGRAIDEAGVSGVAGTVAGDDTVLVVAGHGVEGDDVADRLETAGGSR